MGSNDSVRGGDLYFLLSGQAHFRVHSHFFTRESKYWSKELTGSDTPGDLPLLKGGNPNNPYKLDDENPADFRLLLGIFYNNKYGDFSHVTVQEWKVILRCAQKWHFQQVKILTFRSLESHKEMDTAERIVLYQENKIPPKYLIKYFVELVIREDYLGPEESRTLGVDNLRLIGQARERLRAPPPKDANHPSPLRKNFSDAEIKEVIVKTFGIKDEDPGPGNPTNKNRTDDWATRGEEDETASSDRNQEDIELGDENSEDRDESGSGVDSPGSEPWDVSTKFPGSFLP